MPKNLILVLVFLTLTPPVFAQNRPENSLKYLWPTDASKHLTSAFGEYRARRFHTGIDVKTWGKTGYKIFAVRSGYILRVSVSPGGYGKVVYLKFDTPWKVDLKGDYWNLEFQSADEARRSRSARSMR